MEYLQFQNRLDQIIALEKETEPNPYQATRILQRIESEFITPKSSRIPAWTRILQPISISAALVIGILIGSYAARTGQNQNNEALAKIENIQNLRSNLFISEIADEDNILNFNK